MSHTFTLGDQNMTEGPVTAYVEACDLVAGQEVNRRRVRRGLPNHRKFFPVRDKHQCLAWNPDVFKGDGRGVAIRLHRSGRAEGWPFPSPSRNLIRKRLIDRETGLHLTLFGAWLLPSWHPAGPDGRDEHTAQREEIVRRCLNLVSHEVAAERRRGQAVILAGDLNSTTAQIQIPGLRHAGQASGLDRILYTPDSLTLLDVWSGPETGVGGDRRHRSRHARFEIRAEVSR